MPGCSHGRPARDILPTPTANRDASNRVDDGQPGNPLCFSAREDSLPFSFADNWCKMKRRAVFAPDSASSQGEWCGKQARHDLGNRAGTCGDYTLVLVTLPKFLDNETHQSDRVVHATKRVAHDPQDMESVFHVPSLSRER